MFELLIYFWGVVTLFIVLVIVAGITEELKISEYAGLFVVAILWPLIPVYIVGEWLLARFGRS